MVTQATGQSGTKEIKRRGRPPKNAPVTVKVPEKKTGERGTDFQRLVKQYQSDTIVKAFVNLRKKLFNEGESVDQMTQSIKKRIADLQNRTNVVH